MKRIIALILVIVMATVLIVACADDTPTPAVQEATPPQEETPETPQEEVPVPTGDRPVFRIAAWGSGYAETYQRAEDSHNAMFDDIELRIEIVPTDFWTFLSVSLAANELPDMFFMSPYTRLFDFAQQGALMDLTGMPALDVIDEGFMPGVIYNGRIYGLPIGVHYINVFYNVDMFEELGLQSPTTLAEFEALCAALYAEEIQPISVALRENWVTYQALMGLAASALGSVEALYDFVEGMNAGETSFGDLPHFDGIIEFFNIVGQYVGMRYMDVDYSSMVSEFATGEAAMFLNGEWAIGDIWGITPGMNVGMFPYPVSNNPDNMFLASDIGIVLAVCANADRNHVETILNRLVDPNLTVGFTYYLVKEAGFGTPFPFYAAQRNLSTAGDQYNEWKDAGRTMPWLANFVPPGFEQEVAGATDQFIVGNIDVDTFVGILDDAWRRMSN